VGAGSAAYSPTPSALHTFQALRPINLNQAFKDITMTHTTKTAARASLSQLQGLATQGVERALAARMTELNAEQVQAVGGGYVPAAPLLVRTPVIRGQLINGKINPEILKQIQGMSINQSVVTSGLNAGNVAQQGVLIGW
jgi:stage V sporulation protein SpoVS